MTPEGGELPKPLDCRHIGKGDLAKSSYNFYCVWWSLIHAVPLVLFTVYVERGGWLKTSMGGEGWQKTSEYHHTGGGRGYKIAEENVIWYLNVPLQF